MRKNNKIHLNRAGCAAILLLLTACEGLFDSIYDEAPAAPSPDTSVSADSISISGTLYIDASSWIDWYYIDLQAMLDSAVIGHPFEPQTFQPYPIPTTLTGEATETTGIYTYWFDVFGQGIAVNEFRTFQPTDPQPAPDRWSFAVHRNNVRTNGGAAIETTLTDIEALQRSAIAYQPTDYTPDEWTETSVWAVQTQMLNSMIGSQGIKVNKVLSSWLKLDIPPMPPAFTLNDHVFILRLSDGSLAALKLENYRNPSGKTCCLTIRYKYPV